MRRNFFDFESPDSAISRFPMTLMKSKLYLNELKCFTNYFLILFNNLCQYPTSQKLILLLKTLLDSLVL
jgi:hypothetical protein